MMVKIDELPSKAGDVAKKYPKVWDSFSALGETCVKAGPLDSATVRLVKLALAIGASSEGAVHSHVRRAIAEGIDPKQLEHVAILAIPTVGFPQAVRAMTWIEDLTE
jgi:alkylhydroperoxidase/carboxymuconolactone decarboxylase family protein YurZ